MAQWIEWIEPFYNSEPVYSRVKPEVAIAYIKAKAARMPKGYIYKSDEEALEDFITVYLAQRVELPDA